MTVIHLEGVSKHYGRVAALSGVDLRFDTGVSVVLGPKGAGKTTMSEIVAGWRPCDAGRVVFPRANGSGPPRVGLAPQEMAVYPTLTVAENLLIYAGLAGLSGPDADRRVAATADLLGIGDALGRQAGSLPGRQQRCVHIALALVANPPVVVLDEPTEGVDLDQRAHLLGVVRALAGEGRTVIVTSHEPAEVELLAPGQVVVLDRGVVRFAGAPADLADVVDLADLADVADLAATGVGLADRGRENALAT